ncbi:Serine/threonine-protein kinase/endoribonuclease ire-1 [Morus notabilis]|uniref:non-specific serine/threonine protein kinase n=2 Tax=Morus notabilis TaxID=981085 RepID=W9S255_9ROSA|nr:Serine/threonine-protein kinase/endoribonuclease ire-1 [Morus notabilis]
MIGKKLVVLLSKEIGRGTDGTVVYEGRYEGREVAVKRLQQSHIKLVDQEIANLIASDHGHNIVRYHGVESDTNFLYLALERCACNLMDLIEMHSTNSSQNEENILGNAKLWKANIDRPSSLLLKLMRDMVSGLVVLHNSCIVHRDLKPQNVLIIKQSSTLCAKLSDMGISRKLSDNRFSLSNHPSSCAASTGWKAPEQLQLVGRQTKKMDLFSLGCILFYCITGGKHPFGHSDERDGNIRKKQPDLSSIEDFPEAFDLISSLLQFDLEKRPEASEVMHHPLFWNAKTRLYFFRDTSDSVSENPNLLSGLQSTAKTVLGTDSKGNVTPWNTKIFNNEINLNHPKIKGTYKFDKVEDLLRFIRNRLSHYRQDSEDIKKHFGSLYEGFNDFFTCQFPKLFFEVYKVVRKYCKEDEFFKAYFEEDQ